MSDMLDEFLDKPPVKVTPRGDVFKTKLVTDDIVGEIEAEVANYPKIISRHIQIEEEVNERLDELCRRNKITAATLLEAMLLVLLDNENTLELVIKEAQDRTEIRKERSRQRNALAKIKPRRK